MLAVEDGETDVDHPAVDRYSIWSRFSVEPALFNKAVSFFIFLFLFFYPLGVLVLVQRLLRGHGGGGGGGGQRVRGCIEVWRLTRAVLTKLATNLAG